MRSTWTAVGFVMVVVVVFPAGVLAEEPPAGLSAPEWRQITGAIELTHDGHAVKSDTDTKHVESLYALEQKLGPEPTIPRARFGYSVAIDGDVAVVGAAWASLAFVFTREPGGWELQQTLEGYWSEHSGCSYESWFFGDSVAIDGNTVVVGTPNYGCYDSISGDHIWGNAFIFEETTPGEWTRTSSVLSLVPNLPPHYLDPYHGSYLGTSVDVSGDTVVAGASGLNSGTGACVIVTESSGSWEFEDLLFSDYPAEGNHFGRSVALIGDTLVAGAPDVQVLLSSEAGRAYVFDRSGATWSQTTELTASDSASSDHFGTSVSIMPPTILVGAPDDDHATGVDAGSAYVFTVTGGVWSQHQKLVALDGEADDRFGAAVALGWGVAVIGAPDDNHGMFDIDAGSAYVFTPLAGIWFQYQKIVAPGGATSDHFGSSVAVWGTTALVGSPFDDGPNVTNTGSAHFFEETAGSWLHDGTVLGVREGLSKKFGVSIASDGDTLVVGTIDTSLSIYPGEGAAYIFVRAADEWELEWVLSPGATLKRFGSAVAVSGDTVLVGADDASPYEGRVFVYTRETGMFGPTWSLEAALYASDHSMGDRFGGAVSIEGDTAVVGAALRDIGGDADCGAVYAFSRSGAVWTESAILESSDPAAEDWFGGSVDLYGDLLVTGAKGDDGGAENAGAAFVYRREAGTWAEEQKLVADVPMSNAYFGCRVALDGTTVVVGSPGSEVSGHTNAGAAHIFVESGGVWSEEQRLTASAPATNSQFGYAVDIVGDTAVIGIPFQEIHPHGLTGSAMVFYRSGSLWSQQQQLVSNSPESLAYYGWAVAASTDGIAVTTPNEHYLPAHQGAVYWYEGGIDETDLSIAMDNGVTEVVPGTPVSYLTVVTNAGPSEAMGATVSDVFPPELLGCSWTCEDFSGALCTPGPIAGDIDDTVELPVGGRLEYTADCMVDPAATGDLVNTASVTTPPGVADTNPLNNIATDLDTLTPVADLSIAKENGVTVLIEGQTTTYAIEVANVGPSNAPASPVTDVFPAELSGCSWTCAPGAGAACTPSGAGDLADLADLPAGSDVIYSATCTVAASSGQCVNTAYVTAPAGVTDPDPLNNGATDTDEVVGLANVIFVDGFESGDTSAWSGTTVK